MSLSGGLDFFGIPIDGLRIAELVFTLSIVVAGIFSVVLFFHWRKYAMGGALVAAVEAAYLLVSVLLISVAFFSIY